MYEELIQALRMLKFFHDTGIYEQAAGDITVICGDDYPELFLRGVEHATGSVSMEELGPDVCCGYHMLYRFGDPALTEYYRLCRLYGYKHSLSPEENPYIQNAALFYRRCYESTDGYFWAWFDDDRHPRELLIETCPDYPFNAYAFLEFIHGMTEYYRRGAVALRNRLARGPAVRLPALPAPVRKREKRRQSLEKALKKAG